MSDDVEHAQQMLALERRAVRRLNATATLTFSALGRTHTRDTMRSVLSVQMSDAVLVVRTAVRTAAATQFEAATDVATVVSGANDRPESRRAGDAFARSWYTGGGGSSGGGGASEGDWDDAAAREAAANKILRIAAYEVADAWNDEHRRNADAHPEYAFVERWCAILDAHLCIRCRRMNGRHADINGTFAEGWPPLHGDCRCIVITEVA